MFCMNKEKIKNFGLITILLFSIIFVSGCTSDTNYNQTSKVASQTTSLTQEELQQKAEKEDKNILDKVVDTFASDTAKLEKDFMEMNDENQTFFTDVEISKSGKDIEMEFTITDNATSKLILNLFTLAISIKTYDVTQDFENLKITFVNSKNKQLGIMTIPNKAIKDLADYAKENDDNNYLENPYADAFWKISSMMYDESVPELIPTSIAEGMFEGMNLGSDADDIAEALAKEVTHMEIDCGYPDNWDADADDDGITYDLQLLASDNTVVPIEGTFETKVYEKVPKDEWGFEFEKGKLIYTRTDTLEGNERLKYFDTWSGYHIALNWDDVESFMASSSDNGIMYVTFTDKEGNSFEAKTGEGSYDGCQVRVS